MKFIMKLYDILKPYLRLSNNGFTILTSDFKRYCEYHRYNMSNFHYNIKDELTKMMLADEINDFTIGERYIVISK